MKLLVELVRLAFHQARADRLALGVVGYAAACLMLVPLASHLTLGSGTRGAMEVGLTMQWILSSAAGGWLGLRAVGLELARRSSAVVLAGPVGPAFWLLGRTAGAGLILAALIAGLQFVWLGISLWQGLPIGLETLALASALWVEGAVVGAVAALISTRTNPLIAAGATFGVWIAGHLSGEYAAVASELGFEPANTLVYAVVPDLDLLDLQTPVVTGVGIDPVAATAALGYGLVWLGILWALTVMSLRTRDVA